jgi:excisionase family DNA binding protein
MGNGQHIQRYPAQAVPDRALYAATGDNLSHTPQKNIDLLTNEEAAAYLGLKPGTLDVWRSTKRYCLPYIKVGRLVRYRKSDLDRFLEEQTRAA